MITAQVLEKLNDKILNDKPFEIKSKTPSDQSGNRNKQISDQNDNATKIAGIVTARKLEGYNSVQISRSSIVTPSAKDFIKEKKIIVSYEDTEINLNQKLRTDDAAWYYWSACHLLKTIEKSNHPDVLIDTSSIANDEDHILSAVKELNQAISRGKVKGGILVVKTSAKAAFLANRCTNMRAVVGNFQKSVEEGIQQLSANVLILEYAYLGKTAMTEMIRYFTTANRPPISEDFSFLEAK